MRPCLRRRRESAEPRLSRSWTISLTRSPAIPAAECSGSAVSLFVPPQRERQRAVLADRRGRPNRNGRRAGAAGPADEAALNGRGRTRRKDRHQKSWFSPAKIAETESSEKTLWIVSARSPETDRTSTLSGFVSGLIGTVSVTITRSKTLF